MRTAYNILCIGIDPDELRIETALREQWSIAARLLVAWDADAVAIALGDWPRWDLVLCEAAAFHALGVADALGARPTEPRGASLVMLKAPGAMLSPADALRRGAADVVTLGEHEHLLMVVERELANADDRKMLRRLLESRETAPLAKLTKFAEARDTPRAVSAAPRQPGATLAVPGPSLNEDKRIKTLIEGGGLVLEYQPIVTLKQSLEQRALFEVLLRLKDPGGALLQPEAFFPTVARHHWFAKLDLWVFRRALATLARMQINATTPAGLFLNLATETVAHETSLRAVTDVLDEAAVETGSIVIELSKDLFRNHPEAVRRLGDTLRPRGHGLLIERFDLDDCWLLRQAPELVSHVKLHCGVLRGAASDQRTEESLRRLMRCTADQGVKVVGLAVDSAEVLPLLYSVGVDFIQGHFVSMPFEELVYPSVHVVEI